MKERPLKDVPPWVALALALTLGLQLAVAAKRPEPTARAEDLPHAPSVASLRLASFGEPVALAKLLMLHLQAFDYQAGSEVPYRKLDYDRLIEWLDAILQLDPAGQYPLMSASRLYAEVPDPVRERKMLEFVHAKFLEDPNRRWPWLAHATLLAKHRLKDLPLARRYAADLQRYTTTPDAPLWVKQMEAFILEDMNELDAARIVIGGLLASGQVKDERDYEMLKRRLESLEARMGKADRRPDRPGTAN